MAQPSHTLQKKLTLSGVQLEIDFLTALEYGFQPFLQLLF